MTEKHTRDQAIAWPKFVNSPASPSAKATTVAQNSSDDIDNPTAAVATEYYVQAANAGASDSYSPVSLQEGLQTIIGMCQQRSGFNPLNPEGQFSDFIKFSQTVASSSFLNLLNQSESPIVQSSHNPNDLINSFVSNYAGIRQGTDVDTVRSSLTNLVSAALSWSSPEEKQSNFTQCVLQQDDYGAYFMLYYSLFTIRAEDNKGTIEFDSEYRLCQAEYVLSNEIWEEHREDFGTQQKTEMQQLLHNLTTEVNSHSVVRAACLETPLQQISN
jgi:hypothetical protein